MDRSRTTARMLQMLRDSAALRSAAYLGSMVGVFAASSQVPYDPEDPFGYQVHHIALPGVVAITGLFARLQPEDAQAWGRRPGRQELRDLAKGVALGSTIFLGLVGTATARGWMSAPVWGWEANDQLAPDTVLASATLLAAQEATLVFNEEVVFRGYGLETLRAAMGLPNATALSAALFARYHGSGWRRLTVLSLAGVFLTLLKLLTGNLWLAAGFHWGWNVMQKAVLGPPDGAPSLRPLHVHGPAQWVGRPGHPDPGYLQLIVFGVLAALAGGGLWARRRA